MSITSIKDGIREWRKRVGREEIIARLVLRKFNARTAEMLADGTYVSEPRGSLRDAILTEMAKDGVSLADEAS